MRVTAVTLDLWIAHLVGIYLKDHNFIMNITIDNKIMHINFSHVRSIKLNVYTCMPVSQENLLPGNCVAATVFPKEIMPLTINVTITVNRF